MLLQGITLFLVRLVPSRDIAAVNAVFLDYLVAFLLVDLDRLCFVCLDLIIVVVDIGVVLAPTGCGCRRPADNIDEHFQVFSLMETEGNVAFRAARPQAKHVSFVDFRHVLSCAFDEVT
jgi:hypothetical protein